MRRLPKVLISAVSVLCVCVGVSLAEVIADIPSCAADVENCNAIDTSYNDVCIHAIRDHVHQELKASLQYLAMAAHFNQDVVNRKGFAEFFFKSASEERQHGIVFMKYLMMRGNANATMIGDIVPEKTEWKSGLHALKDALDLEKKVTRNIQVLTQSCSDVDDFHAADFLTTEFLDEQLKGLRELSGKIANLRSLTQRQPNLGEFLFDLELQSE